MMTMMKCFQSTRLGSGIPYHVITPGEVESMKLLEEVRRGGSVLAQSDSSTTFDTVFKQAPFEFWVKYGNVIFAVTPAQNSVDSLKKAMKAKMPFTVKADTSLLTVKSYMGEELDVHALLQGNSSGTPYHVMTTGEVEPMNAFEVPVQAQSEAHDSSTTFDAPFKRAPFEFWVKYGNVIFAVTPAQNSVDSLKKAMKAKMPFTVKADTSLLTVKSYMGEELDVHALLQGNSSGTPYHVMTTGEVEPMNAFEVPVQAQSEAWDRSLRTM